MVEHLGQYDSGISYKKVIFWFILAALIISLGAGYFVLSRVTIFLVPKTQTREMAISVTLDPQAEDINYETNTIRGLLLEEQTQLNQTFQDIPAKKLEENARGTITVKNGYTRAQGFKQGDVLITVGLQPEQKVTVTKDVIIYRNQTKDIEVAAVEKGVAGHIPPAKFKFEKYDDFMNEKVTAKSNQALAGGIRTAQLITENDLSAAQTEMKKKGGEQNLKKLEERLRPGEELNSQSVIHQVLVFTPSIAPNTEQASFTATINIKTSAPIFKKNDLKALIEDELRSMADTDQELTGYNEDSLSYAVEQILPGVQTNQQKAIIKVTLKGQYRPKLPTGIFDKEEIKGFNERALRTYYDRFAELEDIEVKFWPSFRKTVPEMDSRIIIELKK
jgi:hypothetical protein